MYMRKIFHPYGKLICKTAGVTVVYKFLKFTSHSNENWWKNSQTRIGNVFLTIRVSHNPRFENPRLYGQHYSIAFTQWVTIWIGGIEKGPSRKSAFWDIRVWSFENGAMFEWVLGVQSWPWSHMKLHHLAIKCHKFRSNSSSSFFYNVSLNFSRFGPFSTPPYALHIKYMGWKKNKKVEEASIYRLSMRFWKGPKST